VKSNLRKSFLIISLLIGWTFCEDTNNAQSETKSPSPSSNRKGILFSPPYDVIAAYRVEAFPKLEKAFNELTSESAVKDKTILNLELSLSNSEGKTEVWKTLRAEDLKESARRETKAAFVFGLSALGIGGGAALLIDGLIRNEPGVAVLGGVLALGSLGAGIVIHLDLFKPRLIK